MRLSHLTLRGYHGFRELELPFPAHGPTVLIGKNGAGKSTILDAIAMFLRHVADLTIKPPRRRRVTTRLPLSPAEVRRGETVAGAVAHFELKEKNFAIASTYPLDSLTVEEFLEDPDEDGPLLDELVSQLDEHRSADLPVLAYYRPNRGVGSPPHERKIRPLTHPQLAAYMHAFEPQVGPFHEMLRWFRAMEDQENEQRLRKSPRHRNPHLQAVRSALERFMSALAPDTYRNLRVERHIEGDQNGAGSPWAVRDEARFLIDKGSISLPLDSLSDGERGALLLVADLAMRLVISHPGAKEPLHGSGIVLIDELELHLHAGWQRRFLPGLMEVFPNLQIIATTHSPQVLSTLQSESVVILRDFQRVEGTPPTFGRDTNSILRDHMSDPARPEPQAKKLALVHGLIDREQYREAQTALDELAGEIGELDPEIVRLRTLAHLVAE